MKQKCYAGRSGYRCGSDRYLNDWVTNLSPSVPCMWEKCNIGKTGDIIFTDLLLEMENAAKETGKLLTVPKTDGGMIS